MRLVRRLSVALPVMFAACLLPAYAQEIHVSQDEAVKAAVSKSAPEYSAVARQLRLQGEVKLDVVIGEEGTIEKIGTTTGNPVLVQCAKDALKRWKFTPFKSEGKTVKAIATLDFTFKM